MIYLDEFRFLDSDDEWDYFRDMENEMSYDSLYPFQMFPNMEWSDVIFDAVTIFYGGNGSGKSTALNLIAEKILNSKMAGTAKGAELVCMMGIAFTTILLGGVTSASILTFGPILNKIGAARNIHPYRRANLLDGTANSLPAIIPFMSVFVFIGSALTGLSPVVVAGGTIYGFVLFFVFLGAVLTGWGCQKEEET